MRKSFMPMTALLLTLLPAAQLAAQSSAVATLVKAGRLLDPRSGDVLSPAAVLVENGKIKEIGSPSRVQADAPAGTKTIDLGGAMLLPGLIDSHGELERVRFVMKDGRLVRNDLAPP
jgi:cytosine/adenosine deaminase-related metal-dependent hydrolase